MMYVLIIRISLVITLENIINSIGCIISLLNSSIYNSKYYVLITNKYNLKNNI